ncbi:MAG: 50S ribosomal protein L1 [Alphaproteobacteria bacterium]
MKLWSELRMGKRLKDLYKLVDKNKTYTLKEAIKLIKVSKKLHFDETVDVAVNLNIDSRKADQNIRGVVPLPHGTGRKHKIAVFARGDQATEAEKAGADFVGAEDLVETIKSGKVDFDRCVATPDLMPLVSKVAKILGPKGLMPNPKLGTVTTEVGKVIDSIKKGQVVFKNEKSGIVHAAMGKLSFEEGAIFDNIKCFVDAIIKERPQGLKGTYVKKMTLSSTMGVGITFHV